MSEFVARHILVVYARGCHLTGVHVTSLLYLSFHYLLFSFCFSFLFSCVQSPRGGGARREVFYLFVGAPLPLHRRGADSDRQRHGPLPGKRYQRCYYAFVFDCVCFVSLIVRCFL